jgi:hypothetical protein
LLRPRPTPRAGPTFSRLEGVHFREACDALLFLVYTNEQAREAMSPQERAGVIGEHQAVMDETRRRGIFCEADPLEPTATATTVRVQGGKVLITDGPFAETKEQLAGYYILECKDLDEALEWAARIPTACGGGPRGTTRGSSAAGERMIQDLRREIEAWPAVKSDAFTSVA